ncbi:MAG: type-F conjugative transfer system secretin TraK, partial [Gammaproteobacteria bacterium]
VASITQISAYQGVNLEGDVYLITNLTNQPLNLQPAQLYRNGAMAIALQTEAIPPKGQTRLFVVKEGAHHD